MTKLFDLKPLVIAAMHLPRFGMPDTSRSMAQLEDYALKNMAVFVEGGIRAVYLQDGTPSLSKAKEETISIMSALGRTINQVFPQIHLGILLQAHDPISPIAVAHASGASFVRIKVFIGALLKAEGIQQGCSVEAVGFRHKLGRDDIKILADVHDRMGIPLVSVPIEEASQWASRAGADGLVLTGSTYEESLSFLKSAHQIGIKKPLLMGGSANRENIAEVLTHADGVIVSSSLKRKDVNPGDIVLWDRDEIMRFMDAARSVAQK